MAGNASFQILRHLLSIDINEILNLMSSNPLLSHKTKPTTEDIISIALLTGGGDRPYAFGISKELNTQGIALDLIGNDELEKEFCNTQSVRFLNLRGDQRSDAGLLRKISRLLSYYVQLIGYAAAARPKIFHILWNNKFELFDRTVLMLYYKLLGKKIVFTAHNVNARTRDGNDSILNRLTLRMQYRLSDHIFVHTEKMKSELIEQFGMPESRVTVIPFGINNSVPNTQLTSAEARERLGIRPCEKAILFFGNITPYKGLEYLVKAFQQIFRHLPDCRLIIAGKPGADQTYWRGIQNSIQQDVRKGRIVLNAEFIPDEQTELYFKAADVLVLPYRSIYQSGVLFLAYSFGLPALVADVGCLKDDVAEGATGYVFQREDPADLARAIERFFTSDLFANLKDRRQGICDFAMKRHSWSVVGQMIVGVYRGLLSRRPADAIPESQRTLRNLNTP